MPLCNTYSKPPLPAAADRGAIQKVSKAAKWILSKIGPSRAAVACPSTRNSLLLLFSALSARYRHLSLNHVRRPFTCNRHPDLELFLSTCLQLARKQPIKRVQIDDWCGSIMRSSPLFDPSPRHRVPQTDPSGRFLTCASLTRGFECMAQVEACGKLGNSELRRRSETSAAILLPYFQNSIARFFDISLIIKSRTMTTRTVVICLS